MNSIHILLLSSMIISIGCDQQTDSITHNRSSASLGKNSEAFTNKKYKKSSKKKTNTKINIDDPNPTEPIQDDLDDPDPDARNTQNDLQDKPALDGKDPGISPESNAPEGPDSPEKRTEVACKEAENEIRVNDVCIDALDSCVGFTDPQICINRIQDCSTKENHLWVEAFAGHSLKECLPKADKCEEQFADKGFIVETDPENQQMRCVTESMASLIKPGFTWDFENQEIVSEPPLPPTEVKTQCQTPRIQTSNGCICPSESMWDEDSQDCIPTLTPVPDHCPEQPITEEQYLTENPDVANVLKMHPYHHWATSSAEDNLCEPQCTTPLSDAAYKEIYDIPSYMTAMEHWIKEGQLKDKPFCVPTGDSPMNESQYRSTYLTDGQSIHPYAHWRSQGSALGYSKPLCTTRLSEEEYWIAYDDVRRAGVKPFDHWWHHGKNEGRCRVTCSTQTSYSTYRNWHIRDGMHPMAHFVHIGAEQGYCPVPNNEKIPEADYRKIYPETKSTENPFYHWKTVGKSKGYLEPVCKDLSFAEYNSLISKNLYDDGVCAPTASPLWEFGGFPSSYEKMEWDGVHTKHTGGFYAINRLDVGSGSVALFIMQHKDQYSKLHRAYATPLKFTNNTDHSLWDLHIGKAGLFAINRKDGDHPAVHIIDRKNSFQSFSLQTKIYTLGPKNSSNWSFTVGAFVNKNEQNDLYIIGRNNQLGKSELRIYSYDSDFQEYASLVSLPLHTTEDTVNWRFRAGDFNNDGYDDLFFVNLKGGEQAVDIHVLNSRPTAPTNRPFQSYLSQKTTSIKTPNPQKWDVVVTDGDNDKRDDVYLVNRHSASGKTEVIFLRNIENGSFKEEVHNFRTWIHNTD